MKNIYLTAAAVVLAIWTVSCAKEKKTEADTVPVIDVAEATSRAVTTHKVYPGYLSAYNEVQLVARVDGYLTSKPYDAGSFVKAGTTLFTIESRNYADAVTQCRASLANAEAEAAYARKNYEAMTKALESDAVSRMEVLQSKSNMETAEASVRNARAALNSAETQLSYCTVRAPFSGHVSRCPYDVGAYLSGAASPVALATLYDDAKTVVANFSIDDRQLSSIVKNQDNPRLKTDMEHIPVSFDEKFPHSYTANLLYLSPSVDKSTGTLLMQALINNSEGELRSGMYCKISLPSGYIPDAVLVRDASIGTDQLGKYLYVVNDSNKVVYTPVKTGELIGDTLRIITSGISAGQRYVTKALLKVRDGMTVKPQMTH